MQNQRSIFAASAFMGFPVNQVPLAVEIHDELDFNHVIGCSKCKKKKRSNWSWPFALPEEEASGMV